MKAKKGELWNLTNQEVVKQWFNGETVWSVEMGGLGPNYELAIQTAIFALLRKLLKTKPPYKKLLKGDYYDKLFFKTKGVGDGHSGATAGAAKTVAYQFYRYGYKHMMNKSPQDRRIQVMLPKQEPK